MSLGIRREQGDRGGLLVLPIEQRLSTEAAISQAEGSDSELKRVVVA